MPRSKFVKGGRVTKATRRFEAWLLENAYQSASEMYPGAVEAETLVYDYINEFPERTSEETAVENHAKEIGWISDYASEVEDPEDQEEIDPEEDWS